VVVLLVDHRDVRQRTPQCLGRFEPAEAGTEDHDVGTLVRHALSLLRCTIRALCSSSATDGLTH
jgi:hypothetical protein